MSSPSVSPVARLVRHAFHGRNRLARAGDRVEGAVLVTAITVVLLGLPIAAAVGSEVYTAESAVSVEQQRTRHRAVATLLEDTPSSPAGTGLGVGAQAPRVPATWQASDGTTRRGDVVANHDVKAGSTVKIWVDDSGAKVDPPMTSEGAVITAVAVAVGLWVALICLMVSLYLMITLVHKRMRLRQWAAEWAEVEPKWTHRSR